MLSTNKNDKILDYFIVCIFYTTSRKRTNYFDAGIHWIITSYWMRLWWSPIRKMEHSLYCDTLAYLYKAEQIFTQSTYIKVRKFLHRRNLV